jgi:hypothetical protein
MYTCDLKVMSSLEISRQNVLFISLVPNLCRLSKRVLHFLNKRRWEFISVTYWRAATAPCQRFLHVWRCMGRGDYVPRILGQCIIAVVSNLFRSRTPILVKKLPKDKAVHYTSRWRMGEKRYSSCSLSTSTLDGGELSASRLSRS